MLNTNPFCHRLQFSFCLTAALKECGSAVRLASQKSCDSGFYLEQDCVEPLPSPIPTQVSTTPSTTTQTTGKYKILGQCQKYINFFVCGLETTKSLFVLHYLYTGTKICFNSRYLTDVNTKIKLIFQPLISPFF